MLQEIQSYKMQHWKHWKPICTPHHSGISTPHRKERNSDSDSLLIAPIRKCVMLEFGGLYVREKSNKTGQACWVEMRNCLSTDGDIRFHNNAVVIVQHAMQPGNNYSTLYHWNYFLKWHETDRQTMREKERQRGTNCTRGRTAASWKMFFPSKCLQVSSRLSIRKKPSWFP